MSRISLTFLLVTALAAPAAADVTIKQSNATKGMGASTSIPSTTFIKGLRMRTEMVTGDTTRVTIFDVASQKMYSFDSKKKEADVWDMQAFAAEIGTNVNTAAVAASVKANGQTRQIAGLAASGYDMDVAVPSTIGGASGMKMTVKLVGPMWVVKDAPGTREYMAFYKAAVDKGWIFSDPGAAKGQPGQAKAMAQMYKQLAETGGVPYEIEMQMKMEGEGPMAAAMAKMGGMTMTTSVVSVETAALADALFAPPADYKLNTRK